MHDRALENAAATDAEKMAEGFEGLSLKPYLDPTGVPTIGYGSIYDRRISPYARVTMWTPPIDQATARLWLHQEMLDHTWAVADAVKVYLTQSQLAALSDFAFNLGDGALRSSTLLQLLNARDYVGAAAQFDRWDHAGGKELASLLRRREAERLKFLHHE